MPPRPGAVAIAMIGVLSLSVECYAYADIFQLLYFISMSFQGPHNQPNQFFGPALAGACIAVVLSVPAAALTAAVFGSTYKIRALIYCTFLLWAVIGAILVYLKTWKAEKQPLSLRLILLWFLSVWMWPLLFAASIWTKRKH